MPPAAVPSLASLQLGANARPTQVRRTASPNPTALLTRINFRSMHRSLRECVDDLAAAGQLLRIETEIDPCLEAAEIHRRVYQAGGPAIYFARVRAAPFRWSAICSARWSGCGICFAIRLSAVRRLVELKIDRRTLWRRPWHYCQRLGRAAHAAAAGIAGPATAFETTIDRLPQLKSWPRRWRGVHHPAAGVHRRSGPARAAAFEPRHVSGATFRRPVSSRTQKSACIIKFIAASACIMPRRLQRGEPLRVNIFVGGPPALTRRRRDAAARRNVRAGFRGSAWRRRAAMIRQRPAGCRFSREADFCITGIVDPQSTIARRAVWRSFGLLQFGARFSRAAGRTGVPSRRCRSGRSPWSAGRRRKTPCSASSSTNLPGRSCRP